MWKIWISLVVAAVAGNLDAHSGTYGGDGIAARRDYNLLGNAVADEVRYKRYEGSSRYDAGRHYRDYRYRHDRYRYDGYRRGYPYRGYGYSRPGQRYYYEYGYRKPYSGYYREYGYPPYPRHYGGYPYGRDPYPRR